MEDKRSWWKKVWHRIELLHTAYWLWEISLAALAAWKSRRFMPRTISPTDYWLPVAVFFGTLAVLTTLLQILTWSFLKIRLWRYPPSLRIAPHGGKEASVEITHTGIPAEWEARIRILETVDKNHPNLNPRLQQSYLHKDGQSLQSLHLCDGDSANITVAEIDSDMWGGGSRVIVPSVESHFGTSVGTGAIIEVNFTTIPKVGKYSRKLCVRASRNYEHLDCGEVRCP